MIKSNSITIRPFFIRLSVFAVVLATTATSTLGQSGGNNNPYSPSPPGKAKEGAVNHPSIAQKTFKIAKDAESHSRPLTDIYKVGIGDVLFIYLKNSTQGSRYCTVQPDGTIDFPLAGENLIAADQTVDDIEEMLSSGITLFTDPQIEVKIREYASHKITVSGLVENPGEKSLQREAIPLFVIRSEAVVSSKATKAIVKRAPLLKLESYDLRAADTDSVLIYPGNSIEFTVDQTSNVTGSFYIAGEINSAGQKEFAAGLTLYQAVIASGGTRGNPKRAVIRRKNQNGLFLNTEYDLRSIKDGRATDPVIDPGDVIEIRK